MFQPFSTAALACAILGASGLIGPAVAQADASAAVRPWMNPALSLDQRAALLDAQLTQAERQALLHGALGLAYKGAPAPVGSLGSAGFIHGVPRLGVPALQETDAGMGVTNPLNARPGDGATAFPSILALGATWSPQLAHALGAGVAREARSKGFNVLLAGGVNLIREPRGGRNFEYLSEDPLLSGVLGGEGIAGVQGQKVISTVKHFALNAQETGRMTHDARLGEVALRQSDLLAFQVAIERGRPGAVMCAYNKVNGDYACDNPWLLTKVLRDDWGYRGWTMSDWGATHRVEAALSGLDQQSGEQLDEAVLFGERLAHAVDTGQAPATRVSEMSRRILRSMLEVGLLDRAEAEPADTAESLNLAQQIAEQSMVLLKNDQILPLAKLRRIAVIGGHADLGVLSGGGSSQVIPVGGATATFRAGGEGEMARRTINYLPTSPLEALRDRAGAQTKVSFADGRYPKAAALLAKDADVAIVFVNQWTVESFDVSDLSLPEGQDALIEAVASANPNTIVVLQTGGPVLMPWKDKVASIVQAWYPGQRGAQALAAILFGDINPSGRLPVTFPAAEAQLPRPVLPGSDSRDGAFSIDYEIEGDAVGYRWYARQDLKPLYPFGYGLSYTRFGYDRLEITNTDRLVVRFEVANLGSRAGADVPQVYLTDKPSGRTLRLLGWRRVALPAQGRTRVEIEVDPRLLADFSMDGHQWRIAAGRYELKIGASAADLALGGVVRLKASSMRP